MLVRSERGTVTAEFAIALPAVLLVLSFAVSALMIPVDRIRLAGDSAEEARAIARGEKAGGQLIGNKVCVTSKSSGFIDLEETACARRLGL